MHKAVGGFDADVPRSRISKCLDCVCVLVVRLLAIFRSCSVNPVTYGLDGIRKNCEEI
jgi:hypothetical protein